MTPLFSAEYGPRNGASSRLFTKKSAPLGSDRRSLAPWQRHLFAQVQMFKLAQSRFPPSHLVRGACPRRADVNSPGDGAEPFPR